MSVDDEDRFKPSPMERLGWVVQDCAASLHRFVVAWQAEADREWEAMREQMDALPPVAVASIMRTYPRGDGPATPPLGCDWWLR